ncbi:fimbria/pilus outer membrane usher protein [Lelliottia sp. CFBP8978]|jgi:outer membrane usher protein|uniref:fimbria/pilus outer membrane usher protein n=1 Tax=Lelliottia sp. CFBP8978 TaxID=3096522 RepID=UPI002A6B8864|nr:fimbria/pilus outer membrane usher protein [Lelliottia sp. CFBP8978]MDY1036762.1 fimbria/pilus outer membrane usher protein [Lelliottia sp. CFBP8978]
MRKTRIAMLCMALFSVKNGMSIAHAENHYDPALLKVMDGAPEIKNIDKEITQQFKEGDYKLHVFLNGDKAFKVMSVTLKDQDQGAPVPCFTREDYISFGIDISSSGVHLPEDGDKTCKLLTKAIPEATYQLDPSQMGLRLQFPQTMMLQNLDGYVPPSQWDEGIPAIIAQYQYTGSKTKANSDSTGTSETNHFLNLTSGINLGAWRLRNNSTWQNPTDGEKAWNNISTYIERTLPGLKSEFIAGDTYTSADTFDSIQLRGVQMTTDTDMYPGRINGFAPVIRGIARSNATVTVKEHNNVIYQTNVTPGPFTIKDLAPVSTGGTLDVTIKESDGSETHFQQNYATITNLQRQGFFKYSLALGRYKPDEETDDSSDDSEILPNPDDDTDDKVQSKTKSKEAYVIQFNSAWGLPYNLTLTDGVQIAESDYYAGNLGIGADLGFLGALMFDTTYSQVRMDDDEVPTGVKGHRSGVSERLAYSRHIDTTDTDIQANARHYTRDYASLADAMVFESNSQNKQKEYEYTVSINQMVMDSQSLFFSANNTLYYDNQSSQSWQAGWNTSIGSAQISLSLSLNKNGDDTESAGWDKQIAVTASLPLNLFEKNNSGTLSSTLTTDTKGNDTVQSGYSGTALQDHQLNYSVQVGRNYNQDGDDTNNGNLDLTWEGRAGEAQIGYAHESAQDKTSWGMNGGIVIHANGVTPGKYSTGAIALVSAPGVAGLPLAGNTGVKTNHWGYALVPDIQPYTQDIIQFDSQTGDVADMDSISQTVTPTRDAVVMAKFITHPGEKMVATLYRGDAFIPYGSSVKVNDIDRAFFVGNDGQVYLSGIPEQGVLTISFGEHQTCHARYDVLHSKRYQQFNIATLHCLD